MNSSLITNLAYVLSAALFIIGLKMLSHPEKARKGNLISASGMFLAVISTLISGDFSYQWIIGGILIGTVLGILAARLVAMTAMPEMVALLNGSGGLASMLVGWAVYRFQPATPLLTAVTIYLAVLIGGVTFTGSIIAWGKLNGVINSRPVVYKGQQIVNSLFFLGIALGGYLFCLDPANAGNLFIIILSGALIIGVLVVLPIGGADMPVVISLLNSYSGLAACAAGFVIQNTILIVAGALVGASGLILTNIMCKAMNRSLSNVLFSGFGAVAEKTASDFKGETRPISVQDTYFILEAANSVVFVPGYGLAVAQAQHVLRELAEQLEKNGTEVKFAIHPVAGRMPGHMNVLLAEANVSYDQLYEMEAINPSMETVDVCVVIGANDVVNPSARNDKSSPIYGMPIINVDKAKTVIVLKRSMATGFAGVANELFYYENTRMLFGDAKNSIQGLITEFKNS